MSPIATTQTFIEAFQHPEPADFPHEGIISKCDTSKKANLFIGIFNNILSYLKHGSAKKEEEGREPEHDCDRSMLDRISNEIVAVPRNEEEEEELEFAFNDTDSADPEGENTRLSVVPAPDSFSVTLSSSNNRMRVALGVLLRLLLPVANKLSRGWNGLRGDGLLRLINRIRETRGLLTTLLAYAANTVSMSLSSVQVTNRFDPLLRVIKLKRSESVTSSPSPSVSFSSFHSISSSPIYQRQLSLPAITEPNEKCVSCVVLAEPPPGEPIKADIVFIHGLHGSLVNTWKQGLWTSEGKLDHFNRPPKPPIRPPKRTRHSRSTLVVPALKRARFCDTFEIVGSCSVGDETSDTFELKHKTSATKTMTVEDSESRYTYECSEPDEIEYLDGDVEYSFPTFKLRVDDLEKNEPIKLTHSKSQRLKKPKKDESYSPCWPGDWLPLDCPGVRVIALNYTTDPYLWRPLWVKKRNRSGLVERAREMTEMLIEKRVGEGHPIVWVGHSKGGIFVKQMIVDAWESGRTAAKNLFNSSRGCFFYSVPHTGSSLADFNLPLMRQSVELTEIQKNCSSILDLHRRFVALYRAGHLKVDVFSFVETALTLMSVLYLRIVTIDSADPGIGEVCGVHLDHREICKPRSRECFLYTELVKMINNIKF